MFPIRDGLLEDFGSWSKAIEYDGSDRMEYIGFVNPEVFPGKDEVTGAVSDTDVAAWVIMKLTYDGASTRIATVSFVRTASGEIARDQIFDNRASLTYT